MHKSLSIIFVALLIVKLGLSPDPVSAQNTAPKSMVTLTPDEKAWLDTRPTIKVRMSNLPPFILMDQGKPAGFSVELLDRIADLIGFDLQYISGISWPEGLEHIKRQDGKVDLILAAMNTPERREFMLFSKCYIEQPYMIYTRQDNNTILNIDDLIGKTVAIEEKQALVEIIRSAYPGIRLMKVKGYAPEALRTVSSGNADAYIGIMSVANYHIAKLGLIHLKKVATAPVSFNTLSFGVRKEWPELVSILNKALNSITPEERLSMLQKWGGSGRAGASSASIRSRLSDAEIDWLKAHPDIQLGFTGDFEPHVIINPDGTYRGLLVDFLDELNKRLGTPIALRTDSVPKILEKARTKQVDGILFLHPERADKLGLLKTKGFLAVHPTVFARRNVSFEHPADFAGKKVAIIDEVYFSQEIIRQYQDQTTVVIAKDALDGLRKVDMGEADLFLGASVHSYLLTKYQFFGISPKYGFLKYKQKFGMAIRPDWPELIPVINKGISSFTENEIDAIVSKWIQLPQKKGALALSA